MARTDNDLNYLLGAKGPLATAWKGYEARPDQIRMALEVARAFKTNDLAIIEAGTGTGKTMAYLLPAILSGKKTIVSTGFKNLQDQIHDKDLPFIRQHFQLDFSVVLLKGRDNYLCFQQYGKNVGENLLSTPEEKNAIRALKDWLKETSSGDLSSLPTFVTEQIPHHLLSSNSDNCLGQNCHHSKNCFLNKVRREAASANLVLINHHLFMADIALKSANLGQVLPDWEAAVFDEAHLLADVATSYFGKSIATDTLTHLSRELFRNGKNKKILGTLLDLISVFGRQGDIFPDFFQDYPKGESDLWPEDNPENNTYIKDFLLGFHEDTRTLSALVKRAANEKEDEELAPLARRLSTLAENMLFISEAQDNNYVYQAERDGRRTAISALPIDVSGFLRGHFCQDKTVIFTSATMALKNDFCYFTKRLGLSSDHPALCLPSPFNYPKQTIFYLPKHLPDIKSPLFGQALMEEIHRLLILTRGRGLVLFTSHSRLREAIEFLKNKKLPFSILSQNDGSKSRLLAEFKSDIHSVLLATHSFWQGVDVPGESLSAVIIDKLPFPRPDLPLSKARTRKVEEKGGNAFMELSIPEAAITLKQGLGRLMRSKNDRGLMAVMDKRLISSHYGKKIIQSLPPSPITSSITDVADFFKEI